MHIMSNFTFEEQELIRKFIFTNPHGDISFIYPQSLYGHEEHLPFISSYSRSKMPLQDKVLMFLDKDKPETVKEFLPIIPKLIKLSRKEDGTLKVPMTTALFNRRWAVFYKHNSIKEQAQFFGYMENISDFMHHASTGSHPLCSPLAKSSRYIFWDGTFPEADKDILSLPNANKNKEFIELMNKNYVKAVKQLTEFVKGHRFTGEFVEHIKSSEVVESNVAEFIKSEKLIREGKEPSKEEIEKERQKHIIASDPEVVEKEIQRFVLDYARVYLIAGVKTSVGFAMNARNLGEMITSMISTPRKEDQEAGYTLLKEAKKITPIILGSEGTVGIDEWQLHTETELRTLMEKKFPKLMHPKKEHKLVRLIKNSEMYSDKFMAALAVFPFVGASIDEIFKTLKDSDVSEILHLIHKHRAPGQGLASSLVHSGIIAETMLPWHINRDILRHRRGSRSRQLLGTRLGFVTPELFQLAGIDTEFAESMKVAEEIFENARSYDKFIAEKLVPWGFKYRSLQTWQLNQLSYIIAIRSRPKVGHLDYVKFARELWAETAKFYPETAKYIEVNRDEYPVELWKKGYSWWDKEGKFRNL